MFINYLKNSYTSCLLVSEEMDNVIEVETEKSGRFVVCFDPLDGSNNIDCLASIGSIFAVYRRKTQKGLEDPSVERDVLQPGRSLIAAGYALYGSATMIVLSTGNGVDGFIYDPSIGNDYMQHNMARIPQKRCLSLTGEFVLTKPKITMKPAFRQYSVNESYSATWDSRVLAFVNSKKEGDNPIPQRYCEIANFTLPDCQGFL